MRRRLVRGRVTTGGKPFWLIDHNYSGLSITCGPTVCSTKSTHMVWKMVRWGWTWHSHSRLTRRRDRARMTRTSDAAIRLSPTAICWIVAQREHCGQRIHAPCRPAQHERSARTHGARHATLTQNKLGSIATQCTRDPYHTHATHTHTDPDRSNRAHSAARAARHAPARASGHDQVE